MLPAAPLQHDFRDGQNDSKVISEISSQESVHILITDKNLGTWRFFAVFKVQVYGFERRDLGKKKNSTLSN